MADYTLKDLQDAFSNALKGQFGGNSAKAPSPTAAAPAANSAVPNMSKLGDIVKEAGPVASAFMAVSSKGDYAATVLGKIASIVPGDLGKGLQGMVTGLENSRQAMYTASKQGLGNLNFPEYNAQIRAAGMTMDQYNQSTQKANGTLSNISGSADKSSKMILAMGEEVQNSSLGKQLKLSGAMYSDELGRIAMLGSMNTKANLNDLSQRNQLANSNAVLANEINRVSMATGKSRDAVMAETEERLKQPQIMGQMAQMSEETRQQFVKSQVQLSSLGPTIGDLGATLATNGRLSKEQRDVLATMGPAQGDFIRAMKMQTAARTDDQRAQAAEALDRAKARMAEYQSSQQYANVMSKATPEMANAYKKVYAEGAQGRGTQQAMQRETGLSGTAALKQQQIEADRVTLQGQKPTGAADPGQQLVRVYSEANEKIRTNVVGLSKNLDTLNTSFGSSVEGVKKLRGVLDATLGTAATGNEAATQQQNALKKVTGGANLQGSQSASPGTPGAALPKLEKRAVGTLGATGQLTEPKDIISRIEKGETVFTPEQLKNFTKNIAAKIKTPEMPKMPSMSDLTDSIKTNMPESSTTVPDNVAASVAESATSSSESAGSISAPSGDEPTLKDVVSALNDLNKSMMQMVSHTAEINDASNKTAKYTGKAMGRNFA